MANYSWKSFSYHLPISQSKSVTDRRTEDNYYQ